MRTAEEWANEIRYGHNHGGIDTVVKQIQLDAMKEGARRAALVESKWLFDNSYTHMRDAAVGAILTTAENWTIKDL